MAMLTIRLTEEQIKLIDGYKKKLQAENPSFRVTQKTVILLALEQLEQSLSKKQAKAAHPKRQRLPKSESE